MATAACAPAMDPPRRPQAGLPAVPRRRCAPWLPLLLIGELLQPSTPARAGTEASGSAGAAAAAALDLPACRAALGLPAAVPAQQLLRSEADLATRLARLPACGPPGSGDALARLDQLERELTASRQRIAEQQAQLSRETARQQALAQDLAQLRRQLLGAAPIRPEAGAAQEQPAATVPMASPSTAVSRATATAPVGEGTAPLSSAVPIDRPSATAGSPLAPGGSTAATRTGAPSSADTAGAAPATVSYTPGRGFTLQAGGASLRLWADARLLGFSSSRYTFNPGQPLLVSPKNPDASYDLSAQQSTVSAAFRGVPWGGWTPAGFALFTLQDNILAEGYSFTPVVYYGELSNGRWRLVAGQNFDVFAPRDPDTLPSGKLAATGNPGAYRPQLRLERGFEADPGFGGNLQLAVASPITTALPSSVDLANLQNQEVVEDNGWPNVEARLNLGFGAARERAAGRRLRPVELGVSGVVGQLRVLDNIRPTTPLNLINDRSVVSVWGAALDGQIALGRRFGLSGELYTGQGLGEYMAGIFQSYNRITNQPVPTSGGWGQVYAYLNDNVRVNLGFGIDNATHSGQFGLLVNSAIFANVVWDVNAWLQLGLEGNYKLTTYDSFGVKNAWVVISEVMLRL